MRGSLPAATALFTLFAVPQAVGAQAPPHLQVGVVAEVTGEPGFTAQQLEDAATVLLTAKAPDMKVTPDAHLWLDLEANCFSFEFPDPPGWVCVLTAYLYLPLFGYHPFGFGTLKLWDGGAVGMGPPHVRALSEIRDYLDQLLDAPIASWRRMSDTDRECWIEFLNLGGEREFWRFLDGSVVSGDEELSVLAEEVLLDGPCLVRGSFGEDPLNPTLG